MKIDNYTIKNIKNAIIDFVISNSFLINVDKIDNPIIPVDKLHPPLNIILKYSYNETLSYYNYFYKWKSGNYRSIVN
jgi:hypothetical protein